MTKQLLQIYRILFEEYGPQHWWPGETRDEIIIGAILTQNTNWSNVEKAISKLKAANLLSLKILAQTKPELVAQHIRPTGYFNQKADRLVTIGRALSDYKIPEHRDEVRRSLLSLKGIGPETADSILLYAFELPYFVIDAYTTRIFSRLGIADSQSSYQDMQHLFMQNLEADTSLYNEYHALIVRHAKSFCLKQPKCSLCPLRVRCNFNNETESEPV